jgi:hypothetical protein
MKTTGEMSGKNMRPYLKNYSKKGWGHCQVTVGSKHEAEFKPQYHENEKKQNLMEILQLKNIIKQKNSNF